MARNDYVFAKDGDVVIRWAPDSSGSPGTYVTVGCPKGTWNVNRSTNLEADNLDNWCDTTLGELEQVTPGTKTVTISGSMEMILDDGVFTGMLTAEEANNVCYIRITATDSDGANTRDKAYKGYIESFNEQYQGSGPSDVSITFRAIARQSVA